jgi:glycerol-3-phosphate dehydrogenase
MDREGDLARIAERKTAWDIVVIGGGATGVGCALDAASRGYDVLLLEKFDLGSGTSSRSTKLIHGGVRYLREGDISLVREALSERSIILKNAPHAAHKLEFIIPCYGLRDELFYGIGLKVYDLLAGFRGLGGSKIISRAETIRRLQTVEKEGLSGGVVYTDGQFDDARLLIDMACEASRQGACIVNYASVENIAGSKERGFEISFRDSESDTEYTVNTRSVINATGIFCDEIRGIAGKITRPTTTYSQGIHVVLDRKFLPSDAAIMIPKTADGRVLFCIPWLEHTLVGTTDTPVNSPTFDPRPMDKEIDFVLETAGKYLAEKPTRADILSAWAGIRPLIKTQENVATSKLSRGHELFIDTNGMVTITGGKWTTYRRMAEDAVDKAAVIAGLEKRRCATKDLPIPPPERSGGKPLNPDFPYTTGDIERAVRSEMARTVEDVLARRMRILFLDAAAVAGLAQMTADILGKELGRDATWAAGQTESFSESAVKYLPDGIANRD